MTGKIFINYRRGDEPGFTHALLGRTQQAFPAERLFIDVDNIPPAKTSSVRWNRKLRSATRCWR